ncbi:hypothetical protein V6N13_038999 [Hibiscus sabdariffa]
MERKREIHKKCNMRWLSSGILSMKKEYLSGNTRIRYILEYWYQAMMV